MRVRYGKPIKVKSLVGNQTSFSFLGGTSTIDTTLGNQVYQYNWGLSGSSKFNINIVTGHKYLHIIKTKDETTRNASFYYKNTSGSSVQPYSSINSLNSLNIFGGTMTATSDYTCTYFTAQQGSTGGWNHEPDYYFIIDLTEIGLDDLTAQQFYNKYNRYFPLIATGEEITIDRGSGNINISPTLSPDYEELEYIESDGNQYMNNGWSKVVNGSLEVKYKVTSSTTIVSYFSTITSQQSKGQAYSLGFTTNNNLQLRWNQAQDFYISYVANNILEVGRTETINTTLTGYSLFSHSGGIRWSGRCYYYWLKLDEEYLFNFIPVLRKSDNKPGMYDMVSKTFYVNQGTGEFTYKRKSTLPNTYQELEYISIINNPTNGYKNGFNTNFTWANVDRIDVDLSVINYSTGHPTSQNNNIMIKSGTSTSSLTPWINLVKTNTNPQYSGFDSFDWSRPYSATDLLVNHKTISFNVTSSSTNKIVFGCWEDAAYSASNNFYRITLSKNNVLVADFIPCQRVSDRVLGFYDVIGQQFYTNQGTGTFLKGNNVNNTISCKVAGGSSDIYYEYNQRLNSADGGNRGSNECSYSYNEANNEFTLTASSNTTHTYFGLACYNLSAMQGHRALCIAKVTDISISDTFNNISFSWALSYATITDRHNVTTAGDWVYAIGTWGATTTANYLNISRSSGTYTQGDYFKVKDVQIIDLTDWFGAGKEPSTVQEFKEKFTKEYYGFCPTPIKLTRYQIEALPNYGYNQLVKNGNFVDSSNWSNTGGTTKAVANNIMTLTATSLGQYDFAIYQNIGNLKANDKYIILFDAKTNSSSNKTINIYLSAGYVSQGETLLPNVWNSIGKIFSYGTDKTSVTAYFGKIGGLSGLWSNGDIIYFKNINIINLTDWYGAGDEPTTIEEFKATFPNKYYLFSKKRLLNKYMINKLEN